MAKRVRIALPGYNADTETDPDNFALYTDQDYVLIKEKQRGSQSVNNGQSVTVNHNLGYVPFALVFAQESGNRYKKCYGYSVENDFDVEFSITTTYIRFTNRTGSTKIFKYYIFYDKVDA